MGFRFFRRIKIAPGLSVNLSKSGASLSLGPRGMKYTIGSRGTRTTLGIPGTGLFYTVANSSRSHSRGPSSAQQLAEPVVRPEDRLTIGFFQNLTTPENEKALVAGCREHVLGNVDASLDYLRKANELADAAFLAGALCLKKGLFDESITCLSKAAKQATDLGHYFGKYGISALISIPITEEITAQVGPNLRGIWLMLVEAYQHQKRWQEALNCLNYLRRLEPEDIVVRLSFAEILLEAKPNAQETYQEILKLAEGVENNSPVHVALLLYKSKALRGLQLYAAARETVSSVLRKKAALPDELTRALRYERALVYEAAGQAKRARAEFEKLYAETPDYEDVASRLQVGQV